MPLQYSSSTGALLYLAATDALMRECCCCECESAEPACEHCDCTPDSFSLDITTPIDLQTACCNVSGGGSVKADVAALDGDVCLEHDVGGGCNWSYDGTETGIITSYAGSNCTGATTDISDVHWVLEDDAGQARLTGTFSGGLMFFQGHAAWDCQTMTFANEIGDFVCDDVGSALRVGKGGQVTLTACCA